MKVLDKYREKHKLNIEQLIDKIKSRKAYVFEIEYDNVKYRLNNLKNISIIKLNELFKQYDIKIYFSEKCNFTKDIFSIVKKQIEDMSSSIFSGKITINNQCVVLNKLRISEISLNSYTEEEPINVEVSFRCTI